jgi:hypothetical protein
MSNEPAQQPKPRPEIQKISVVAYTTASGNIGREKISMPKPPWEK